MARSKGTIISVKVPIRWNVMTERQRTRLSRITGRDTRVIKAYLGVIERHQPELLVGRKKNRIDTGKLEHLTITANMGNASRTSVPHDFKCKFPTMSANEFQECRDTAIAMWHSYLGCGGATPLHSKSYTSRKIPRFAFKQRFELLHTPGRKIRHWLKLRDSLDSVRQGRRIHDRLTIPLSPSSYHLNRIKEGDLKTVRLFKDSLQKWWAIFTVTLDINPVRLLCNLPAVLAIDLGIKKTACSILLTQDGYKQVRYWKQDNKLKHMEHYDKRVASLQKKKEDLRNRGIDANGVTGRLRKISRRRFNLSREYDKKLVKDISDHILHLSEEYDLYVAIGKLSGIRGLARKGNYKGRAYRGMIHRWTFARVRNLLEHKLAVHGFDTKRFLAVHESWTSIKCHKCGHKGIRPKQNLFICHTCGYRANADLNGAINIGRRVIMLIPSLKNEKTGLGMWLLPKEKSTPKARRSTRSKRKSSLPQRLPASPEGESVVDCHIQTTLEMSKCSEDPAMAKIVEDPPAAVRKGAHGIHSQRTEATSRQRNYISVKSGKAHVILPDVSQVRAGDSGREQGGTQKFLDGSLTIES